ncbi:MAG: IS110 family transposase [Verrucomicrobiales bacterium]|jgi:transposase|nr:IS110 family transposase [Verrucomicrobiales bacterium]
MSEIIDKLYLGVDVASHKLDLATGHNVTLSGLPKQVLNHPTAIKRWLRTLPAKVHLVCEATGPYHKALWQACWQRGVTVSCVNPGQVRDFAKSRRLFAKTDRLDARLLADFAAALTPAPTHVPDPTRAQLLELNTRRSQLVAFRAQELTRQQQPSLGKSATASLRRSLNWLTREIDQLEAAAADLIDQTPILAYQRDLLCQVEGVSLKTAAALLATIPELGTVSRQRSASLAGLAPFVHQSGQFKGQVHIHGGRLPVRQALYMPALSAMRCNPVLKPLAQRLTARGKPFHVVITAVMRKLLCHLNAKLQQHPCPPQIPPK